MTLLSSDTTAPIGVFDSGLGGLTVARQIRTFLPNEPILYLADQAHVPYGGRELSQVCGFACGISEALLRQGCKALVMACNISSATALRVVQSEHPNVPILGVILPGAQAAAHRTRNGRVGILATEGTVKSGAYTRALHALDPALHVTEVGCPAFVPLVESGRESSLDAESAARLYISELIAADVDTVVLGCTHYPFLLPVLTAAAPHLAFVDPAQQTVQDLKSLLQQADLLAPNDHAPHHRLSTTGNAADFAAQSLRFLESEELTAEFVPAQWHQGTLRFG